jgi:beta-glucosidase
MTVRSAHSVRRMHARACAALTASMLAIGSVRCDDRGSFDPSSIERAPIGAALNRPGAPTFLLGTATAAHQIEGGLDNDWTVWEQGRFADGRPHIVGDQRSGDAVRSWDLWAQDIAAMRRLGANSYRFGVEWSRLEPTPGAWDLAAVERYRAQMMAMRAAGITPFVTLYHFTLPRWFAERGGWEHADAVAAFERFSERAAAAFGDLVDFWCTINEPTVYVVQGYFKGEWPPGVQSPSRGSAVLLTLLRAHARSTAALRRLDTVDADGDGHATRIGLAHHLRIFQPASTSPLDREIAALTDDYNNTSVPRAAATGRVRLFIPSEVDIDEEVPGLRGSFDYLGVNYYTRDVIRADLGSPTLSVIYTWGHRPVTDLGWDDYPEGLYRLLVRMRAYGLPIYITESGVADARDTMRRAYLRSHVYAVERAIAAGADVRGFYYWSLMDNFEWANGYNTQFGLFTVDRSRPDMPRAMRPSGEAFREIARNAGLSPIDP